jgi:hypothetical protein
MKAILRTTEIIACILILVMLVISLSEIDLEPSSTPTPTIELITVDLDGIITNVTPYNQVFEIADAVRGSELADIHPGALVNWIERGFEASLLLSDPDRTQYFYALDIAAVLSEGDGFAPLMDLWARSDRVVYDELRSTDAGSDLVLYKLYNEGVVIQATDLCVGIDIVLEPRSTGVADGLADTLDALLVTHEHGDHYQPWSRLNNELSRNGRPIILPTNDLSVPLGGVIASGEIGRLRWVAFRGEHYDHVFSSFYYLEIDGWRIIHSGDNTAWMAFAESDYARDAHIFLYKPESSQGPIEDVLRGIGARVVIPHHLLELGHGLGAYGHDMGIRLHEQVPDGTDVVMLQWGETMVFSDPSQPSWQLVDR